MKWFFSACTKVSFYRFPKKVGHNVYNFQKQIEMWTLPILVHSSQMRSGQRSQWYFWIYAGFWLCLFSAKIALMILWIIDDEIICSCALRKFNRLIGDSMWLQKWMDGWMFFICLPMQIFTKWRTSPHPCERLEPF